MTIKEDFDKARKAWPGVKASLDVEWDNLSTVCKHYKLSRAFVIPQLMPSIERYSAYCKQREITSQFVESPCSFTVYINQRRWTREYPAARVYANPPCKFCGKPSIATYLNNPHCQSGKCRVKAQE